MSIEITPGQWQHVIDGRGSLDYVFTRGEEFGALVLTPPLLGKKSVWSIGQIYATDKDGLFLVRIGRHTIGEIDRYFDDGNTVDWVIYPAEHIDDAFAEAHKEDILESLADWMKRPGFMEGRKLKQYQPK